MGVCGEVLGVGIDLLFSFLLSREVEWKCGEGGNKKNKKKKCFLYVDYYVAISI